MTKPLLNILNLVGHLYYRFFLKLLIRGLSKHNDIELIIINGSFARGEIVFFKSDLDVSIILKGHDKEAFKKSYIKRLRFISAFFPYFLPIDERLNNVFSLEELSLSNHSDAYKAYLRNEPYRVVFGDSQKLSKIPCSEIDQYLYEELKITQLIKPKSIHIDKIKSLSAGLTIEHNSSFIENNAEQLKKINFFQSQTKTTLRLPIFTDFECPLFIYQSLNDLILNTRKYREQHPYLKSLHFCYPWIIITEINIKVYHVKRLALAWDKMDFSEAVYNHIKAEFHKDLAFINENYLEGFKAPFIPTRRLDNLTKKVIPEIASFISFYQSILGNRKHNTPETFKLSKAIKYISGEHTENQIKVSLCICTKNRNKMLLKLFDSIYSQTELPHQILIINNGKRFDTEMIMKIKCLNLMNLKIIDSELGTISSLRNLAILESEGDIVSFTDDDCLLSSDWIEKVLSHFKSDPSLEVLGGNVRHWPQLDTSHLEVFHRTYLGVRK
jgi:predicted nucleotidyltransferase